MNENDWFSCILSGTEDNFKHLLIPSEAVIVSLKVGVMRDGRVWRGRPQAATWLPSARPINNYYGGGTTNIRPTWAFSRMIGWMFVESCVISVTVFPTQRPIPVSPVHCPREPLGPVSALGLLGNKISSYAIKMQGRNFVKHNGGLLSLGPRQ